MASWDAEIQGPLPESKKVESGLRKQKGRKKQQKGEEEKIVSSSRPHKPANNGHRETQSGVRVGAQTPTSQPLTAIACLSLKRKVVLFVVSAVGLWALFFRPLEPSRPLRASRNFIKAFPWRLDLDFDVEAATQCSAKTVDVATIKVALSCHQSAGSYFAFTNGIGTTNRTGGCAPYPRELTDPHNALQENGGQRYAPPSDVTAMTVLESIDRVEVHSSSVGAAAEGAGVKRNAPSLHSRWLFDEWRLWEGELGCPSSLLIKSQLEEENENEALSNEFVTIGAHRASNPNSLYQLDYVCVDEAEGTLFGFDAGGQMSVPMPEGRTEHPFSPNTYATNERMFSPANIVKVPLVVNEQQPKTQRFQDAATASLSAHFEKMGAPPPSIFFVDGSTVVYPIDYWQMDNPGHTNHRLASAIAQRALLNASSLIFASEQVAIHHLDVPIASKVFTTQYFTATPMALVATDRSKALANMQPLSAREALLLALPRYFLNTSEVAEVDRIASREAYGEGVGLAHLQAALNAMPRDSVAFDHLLHAASGNGGAGLPREMASAVVKKVWDHRKRLPRQANPVGTAIQDVFETLSSRQRIFVEYMIALSSGAEGCEQHRCAEGFECSPEALAAHRRCAVPHTALTVSLHQPATVDTPIGVGPFDLRALLPNLPPKSVFNLDTANFTRFVWNGAVRLAFREAKRLKRDAHAVAAMLPVEDPVELTRLVEEGPTPKHTVANPYAYILEWRRRLVRLMASKDRGRESTRAAVVEYMTELFAVAAERLTAQEAAGKKDAAQLMCYRKMFVSHVRYFPVSGDNYGTFVLGYEHQYPGSFMCYAPSNCNLRQVMDTFHASAVQRYSTCPISDQSTNELAKKNEQPLRRTSRAAHPLFVLPESERRKLKKRFSDSVEAINAILREAASNFKQLDSGSMTEGSGFFSSGDLRLPPRMLPSVLSLIKRVDKAQRAYDDVFMTYFDRFAEVTAATPPRGRPVRSYSPIRTSSRAIALFRPMLSRLFADDGCGGPSMRKFIDVELIEGFLPTAYTLKSEGYKATPIPNLRSAGVELRRSEALRTPRARQFNAVATADLLIGAHGGDLHVAGYLKPSAMMVEIGTENIDQMREQFNAGYFTNLAFAREFGYLRILAHSRVVAPYVPPKPGLVEEEQPAYQDPLLETNMNLPDLRQIYSLAFCGWLATNSVRLTDDANENFTEGLHGVEEDFAYLLPWWCRGGSSSVVRKLLRAMGSTSEQDRPPPVIEEDDEDDANQTNSRHSLSADAVMRPSYYTVRAVPSGYGFVEPFCPPFHGTVVVQKDEKVDFKPKDVRYEDLIRLQNECATGVTLGTQGRMAMFGNGTGITRGPIEGVRFRVELLQTLLETTLLGLDAKTAQRVARIVEANTREGHKSCAGKPIDCFARLMRWLLGADGEEVSAEVSERLRRVASPSDSSPFTVNDTSVRSRVAEWITEQYDRIVNGPPFLTVGGRHMLTDEFSYGADCRRWMPPGSKKLLVIARKPLKRRRRR